MGEAELASFASIAPQVSVSAASRCQRPGGTHALLKQRSCCKPDSHASRVGKSHGHFFWIAALSLLTAAGCSGSSAQSTITPQSLPPAGSATLVAKNASGIRTITVERRGIPEYLQISGRVVPDPTRVVHVFPAAGGRVLEMTVRPWDRVEKGQTLALIESGEVSRAMADYEKARVDAATKKKALVRADDLYSHHAIAEKDLEQAEADSQMANQEEQATFDGLHLLGVDPAAATNQLRVLAPRSGVVLDIGTATGELSKSVDAPQPLCTLADLSTVWVEGDVFEQDVAALKPGAAAEVTFNAYPGEKWNGNVSVVSDAVDPATRTLKVRVVLSNSGLRLKPDMFATVQLLQSTSQGILIPSASVIRDGATASVFVATGGNRFERRVVVLGRTEEEDNVEVTSGLTPGAVIVSDGALLLRAASQN